MPSEPVPSNLDDAERLARELGEYGDHDEEATNPVINVHNHFDAHDGGQTRVELPAQQVVKAIPWPAIGAGVGALAVAALAALLQHCQH